VATENARLDIASLALMFKYLFITSFICCMRVAMRHTSQQSSEADAAAAVADSDAADVVTAGA